MSHLSKLLLSATCKGTSDYAGFKSLSAVEIGEILMEARAEEARDLAATGEKRKPDVKED